MSYPSADDPADGSPDDAQETGLDTGTVPVAFVSGDRVEVAENTDGAFYTAVAEGAETFAIAPSADDDRFAIDAASGALRFVAPPDFEAAGDQNGDNLYQIVLSATNPQQGADTLELEIEVTDVDEMLELTSDAVVLADEGAPLDGAVQVADPEGATDPVAFSLAGPDNEWLTVHPRTGRLAWTAAPDFERPRDADHDNRYDVVLLASDGRQESALPLVVALQNDPSDDFSEAIRTARLGDPVDPVVVDVDRDDRLDLVVVNRSFSIDEFLVLRGDDSADQLFMAPERFTVGMRPQSLDVADLNRDERLDVVTVNNVSNDVSVLLGQGSGPLFGTRQDHATRSEPTLVIAEDLDGDGWVDLITGHADGHEVSVLMHDGVAGTPTFAAPVPYAVGWNPRDLRAEDVNGDGHPDLLTVNADTDDVSVLIGAGDGTFAVAMAFDTGENPSGMDLGDVDNDGILDIVTANVDSDDLTVLRGQGTGGVGDGTFGPPVSYDAGRTPRTVRLVDIDQDGVLDIVAANIDSDDVAVLLGEGPADAPSGTFGAAAYHDVPDRPLYLETADVNQDGGVDLLLTHVLEDEMSVLLGQPRATRGGGGFGDRTALALGDVQGANFAFSPMSVAAPDVDRDGVLDVVAGHPVLRTGVFLGEGIGGRSRGTLAPVASFDTGGGLLSPADVDADGLVDLLAIDDNAGFGDAYLTTILGQSTGPLWPEPVCTDTSSSLCNDAGDRPRDLVTVDVDGDDVLDVLIADGGADAIRVLLGHKDGKGVATGELKAPVDYAVGVAPAAVRAADVNADGVLDLIAANAGSDDISVRLGESAGGLPSGTFGGASDEQTFRTGEGPVALAVADVDTDGILDVLTVNGTSGDLSVLLGQGTAGLGDGTFAPPVSYNAGTDPSDLVVADINGDGVLDAVVADRGSDVNSVCEVTFYQGINARGSINVLLGNGSAGEGDGTFGEPVRYEGKGDNEEGDRPNALVLADVDNDGLLDAITTSNLWDPCPFVDMAEIGVRLGTSP